MPGQEVGIYRERADCESSVTGNLVIERLLGTTGAEERGLDYALGGVTGLL